MDSLRRHRASKDWLGLANSLLDTSHELFPPFETIREPLRTAIGEMEAFLVCKAPEAQSDLRVLSFPEDQDAPPRVLEFKDRLPDDSGWMVKWELHVGEAFVLSSSMAEIFLAKYRERPWKSKTGSS